MNLSPEEIADMRLSDPELYTCTLESKLEMMHAQLKHQENLEAMVKKSMVSKLAKEQATTVKLTAELKGHESLKEQFYQLECDSDMLSNTNEQLRRRVDDQKTVVMQLTAALVRILDHHSALPVDEPIQCHEEARLLLQSLQRGAIPGSAASAAADLSDDEAPSPAVGGFRTFFSSLVTRLSTTAPPSPPHPTDEAPSPPSLDSSFRALIDELGSAAVAPFVSASVLSQLPAPPAPPAGTLTTWLHQHERAASRDTSTALRVVADATSARSPVVSEAPAPAAGPTAPQTPMDDAELTVMQMLHSIVPAAPAELLSGDHSSTGTDADIEADSQSLDSDDEDETAESVLTPEAILSGARAAGHAPATRLTGFPAAADVDRMTQRLRSKPSARMMPVPDAALNSLVRARRDPEAERRVFLEKVAMDEKRKIEAELKFLHVFGNRLLIQEETQRADFQRHLANMRTHLSDQPLMVGKEDTVIKHFEDLFNSRRAQNFNGRVNDKLRDGLMRILSDPQSSLMAREQALFFIERGTTLTCNDTSGPVTQVLCQHLDTDEYFQQLDLETIKPKLEQIKRLQMARLQDETKRDRRVFSTNIKKGYQGDFGPMRLVSVGALSLSNAVNNITGNHD